MSIPAILASAEACFGRKQFTMVRRALGDIESRLNYEHVSDDVYVRIVALKHSMSSIKLDVRGRPCDRCGASGKYPSNGQTCFGCKGKGYQDEADVARNASYRARKPHR